MKYLIKLFLLGLPIKSFSTDNGSEFMYSKTIEKTYNIEWFYCDPYCSSQRALNERLNRDLRGLFPKGTDFNNVSDIDIKKAKHFVNSLRRVRHNLLTSAEYLQNVLQQNSILTFFQLNVILILV